MSKTNNQAVAEELTFIKDWCLTIIEYFDSISNNNMAIFKDGILKGYETKNLRGLRLALRDITKMAQYMDNINVYKINKLLKEKFGKDLNDQSGKTQKEIDKIIRRGKILNSDEFRMLNEKVGEIYHNDKNYKDIEILNKILIEYEQSKK